MVCAHQRTRHGDRSRAGELERRVGIQASSQLGQVGRSVRPTPAGAVEVAGHDHRSARTERWCGERWCGERWCGERRCGERRCGQHGQKTVDRVVGALMVVDEQVRAVVAVCSRTIGGAKRQAGVDKQTGWIDLPEPVEPHGVARGEAGQLAPPVTAADRAGMRDDLVMPEPRALKIEDGRGDLTPADRARQRAMQCRPVQLDGARVCLNGQQFCHSAPMPTGPDQPPCRPPGPVPDVHRDAAPRRRAYRSRRDGRTVQHGIAEGAGG